MTKRTKKLLLKDCIRMSIPFSKEQAIQKRVEQESLAEWARKEIHFTPIPFTPERSKESAGAWNLVRQIIP